MIKGIIFDLDGTTIATEKELTRAVNYQRKICGLSNLEVDEVKPMVGHGFRNLLDIALNHPSETKLNEYLESFKAYYKEIYIESRYYDGIPEMFKRCEELKLHLGINSNKMHDYTVNLIEKNFPNVNFDLIIGASDKYPHKPDPKGALEIIKKMGLTLDDVIYVGDSEADVETARNLKIKCIGCTWGFRSQKEVEALHFDYLVSNPKELLNKIEQLVNDN